jgi:predicted branched-subunit amino acid permease
MALSLLMFTGGSQFAFVGIVANGLHAAPAAIAASSMLGIRNGLYALELTHLLGVRGPRRLAAAHLTIDESTAVAVAQDDERSSRLGFWLTGLTVFALWNLSTLAGALVGGHVGDPRTYGLDAAACAAFTALLWPRLRNRDAVAIAIVGAVVAIVLSPTMPPGIPVVAAAAAALLAWRTPRRERA